MRILHLVEFYEPSVGGAQECVKQISERLVQSGHEVTVFTSSLPRSPKKETIRGVSVRRFSVKGNLVRGITGTDSALFQKSVIDGEFDVIMCYAAQQWTFDLLNEVIKKISAKKVLVPCGFSGLNDPNYHDYYKKMPKWLKEYDQLVLLSETYQDATFIKKYGLVQTRLIPNCADEREFDKVPSQRAFDEIKQRYQLNRRVLCTIGGFTGMKGQMETMAVFKRLPMQDISLVVIGNNDFNQPYFDECKRFAQDINKTEKNKNVVLLEMGKDIDRTSTIKVLQMSEVFLFMSYIEASPLVIFESMAAGTAFLSSRVGNVKEIISWTKAGWSIGGKKDAAGMFKANKITAFVKLLLLLSIKPIQTRLARNGRKQFTERYNWRACSRLYETMYKELV